MRPTKNPTFSGFCIFEVGQIIFFYAEHTFTSWGLPSCIRVGPGGLRAKTSCLGGRLFDSFLRCDDAVSRAVSGSILSQCRSHHWGPDGTWCPRGKPRSGWCLRTNPKLSFYFVKPSYPFPSIATRTVFFSSLSSSPGDHSWLYYNVQSS